MQAKRLFSYFLAAFMFLISVILIRAYLHQPDVYEIKAERALLESIGFKKDWTGKAWQIWNPSNINVQNVDVKEAGAEAYADVMKAYGFKAYAGSRLD